MIDIRKLHQQQEENELQQHHIYEKILYKCHHRIITVSKKGETFSFFVVPEFEFGVPRYDPMKCCHFIIKKLTENGFLVRYTHPNLVYISWDKRFLSKTLPQIENKAGDGGGRIAPSAGPNPLPLTQETNDYRPSGRLSSQVSKPVAVSAPTFKPPAIQRPNYNYSYTPKNTNTAVTHKPLQISPPVQNINNSSSGIVDSILTKPVKSISASGGFGGGVGGGGGSSINSNINNTKNISWDPNLPTNKTSVMNNVRKISASNGSNSSVKSDFDSSQDLLGNLDVVDIKF